MSLSLYVLVQSKVVPEHRPIQDSKLKPDKDGLYRIDDMILTKDQIKSYFGYKEVRLNTNYQSFQKAITIIRMIYRRQRNQPSVQKLKV